MALDHARPVTPPAPITRPAWSCGDQITAQGRREDRRQCAPAGARREPGEPASGRRCGPVVDEPRRLRRDRELTVQHDAGTAGTARRPRCARCRPGAARCARRRVRSGCRRAVWPGKAPQVACGGQVSHAGPGVDADGAVAQAGDGCLEAPRRAAACVAGWTTMLAPSVPRSRSLAAVDRGVEEVRAGRRAARRRRAPVEVLGARSTVSRRRPGRARRSGAHGGAADGLGARVQSARVGRPGRRCPGTRPARAGAARERGAQLGEERSFCAQSAAHDHDLRGDAVVAAVVQPLGRDVLGLVRAGRPSTTCPARTMTGATPPSSLVIGLASSGVRPPCRRRACSPGPQTIASWVVSLPVMCTSAIPRVVHEVRRRSPRPPVTICDRAELDERREDPLEHRQQLVGDRVELERGDAVVGVQHVEHVQWRDRADVAGPEDERSAVGLVRDPLAQPVHSPAGRRPRRPAAPTARPGSR